MLGRGSRTRGVCNGILFKVTKDKSSMVIDKLLRQNSASMDDLERLLRLFELKGTDSQLQVILKKAAEQRKPIRRLAQVEEQLTEKQYGKLILGVFN
jgi:hypothetical protein